MLLEENRNLTDTVFDWDNKVIQLQGELIGSQDKQLREMAPTVERAVKESVEKSYSSVVTTGQPAQSAISSTVIQRTVKDIAEGEERSKNVIIFGLEEQDEENVEARVSEIIEVVGEKARPETVSRMGNKRTDYNRPVIVKLKEHRRIYRGAQKSAGSEEQC